jgi:hypothetical protein
MPRITISYRRDDSLDITGRIFDRLAGHFGREAVFRDIDSVPPGVDFRRHIDRVLDESDIILAIVGPRWIGPDNEQRRLASPADPVRLEIETALRKDKPLIPVLVSRAVMPQPEALPDSLHDFAYRNAIQVDSGQDFDVHVGRLIRAIEQKLPLDEERAADAAGQRTAAIGVSRRIKPTPKEPPVDPVAPPSGRPVRPDRAHTARWPIGLALLVMLELAEALGLGPHQGVGCAEIGGRNIRPAGQLPPPLLRIIEEGGQLCVVSWIDTRSTQSNGLSMHRYWRA